MNRLFLIAVLCTPLSLAAEDDAPAGDPLAAARAAQEAGKLDDAADLYDKAAESADASVRCVAREGQALVESWLGRYDSSVKHYREVRDRCPDQRRAAIYGAARVLGWGRQFSDGLHELEPALKEWPEDRELNLLEAQVAGWGGHTNRSVASYHKVLQLYPGDVEAGIGLAKVLSWGSRLYESEREFKKVIAEKPDADEALVGLTYVLIWQGRPHDAREYFDRISPGLRASKDYRILQAALEWALLDRDAAARHLDELMHELPGEPDVRDLWHVQSGVRGPNLRGEGTILRDSEGLGVDTVGVGGSAPLGHAGTVFADGRYEWLEQDAEEGGFEEDDVTVKGGRLGLEWNLGHALVRGTLGQRESDVDTGGTVGGLSVTALVKPNIFLTGGVDSDFAFYTPRAVRSDVRMTGFNLGGWSAVSPRWTVNAMYMRTHFEGPQGALQLTSPDTGGRRAVDQNRDLLSAAARWQAGGTGGDWGNLRFELGARAYTFRFDRTFPEVGYWNPKSFRQFMATGGLAYRRSEELVVNLNAAVGVHKQEGSDWEASTYLYGELLRQLTRRIDFWVHGDYATSGFTRRSTDGDYSAWTAAAGLLVRVGRRSPGQ